MHRVFLPSLAFLVLLNALVKPAWVLGIDLAVQNRVGTETYGLYFVLFSFSILFNFMLDMGITSYNNKTIASSPGMLESYLPNILFIKAGLAIIYLLITISAALFLGYSGKQVEILGYLALNQALASMLLYLRSNVSGLHHFRVDAMLSILDKFLMILACAWLLWILPRDAFRIEWFVYAQTAAYVLTIVVAGGLVAVYSSGFSFRPDRALIKKILRESYPFALLIFLMALYTRLDSVMIERLLPAEGDREAGVYASAYRLLDATNMAGILFATILLPMFSGMLSKSEDTYRLVQQGFTGIMLVAIPIAVTGIIFSEEIMFSFYHEATERSAAVFRFLIASFVPISSIYIFGTLLTANGSLRILIIIAVASLAINFGLNLLLIPRLQSTGAAETALITQVFSALAHIAAAYIILGLPFRIKLFSTLGLFTLIITAGALILKNVTGSWITDLAAIAIFCIVVSFGLKLISLKNLAHMVKHMTRPGS